MRPLTLVPVVEEASSSHPASPACSLDITIVFDSAISEPPFLVFAAQGRPCTRSLLLSSLLDRSVPSKPVALNEL